MRGLQKMWIWASRIRVKNHPGGWIQGDTRLGFSEHLWTSPHWGIPWASGQSQIFPVNEAWIELGKSDSQNCIIRDRTDGCWTFWMPWASVGFVEDFDVFLNISKPKVNVVEEAQGCVIHSCLEMRPLTGEWSTIWWIGQSPEYSSGDRWMVNLKKSMCVCCELGIPSQNVTKSFVYYLPIPKWSVNRCQ